MHCANEGQSVCVPCCFSGARMPHALSPSRGATPNHTFEGTTCLAPLRFASQRRRGPSTQPLGDYA